MKILEFINFNDHCPVCNNKLTLYMHVSGMGLWKSEDMAEGVYKFVPHIISYGAKSHKPDGCAYLHLDGDIRFTYDNSALEKDARSWQFFLFKICGHNAFVDNQWDYDINWYDACYFRSSPYFEFKNNDINWWLDVMQSDQSEMVNRDESFLFKVMGEDNLEKVYALNLDYEGKHTKFYYYLTTEEERSSEDFEPKIFEKTDLPLLPKRPDFSEGNRDQLISKFNYWIMLS